MAVITVKHEGLEYLTAENISVPHCFTTRLGGVSSGYLEGLNLGANRGDDYQNVCRNYEILGQALGFTPEQLVLTRQTHSDIVRAVDAADAQGLDHRDYPECDALITDRPGVGLVVFTADCTPILLHDPCTGAVGAIHAGWRGTAANIAGKTVEEMVRRYGCYPANIRAAIGPNVGQCCFETDWEVPEAMLETYGSEAETHFRAVGNKCYVNLKNINALALQQAGVRRVEISSDCTACMPQRYWSHRRMGDQRGSQGAVILCQEVDA